MVAAVPRRRMIARKLQTFLSNAAVVAALKRKTIAKSRSAGFFQGLFASRDRLT